LLRFHRRMIRRLARKSAKYAGVGMGLCGAATLVNMKLNDDMDDLAYMFQRPLSNGPDLHPL